MIARTGRQPITAPCLPRRWEFARSIVALLALSVVMAGCVPFPHRYQHTPHITGTVRDADSPAVGTRIGLAYYGGDPCSNAEVETTTDDRGRFDFPGERRVRLYVMAAPAHSLESWAFCFRRGNAAPVVWS